MANEADLKLIEIGEFEQTSAVAGTGEEFIVVRKADGKTYKMSTADFKAFLGTVQTTVPRAISPTDPAPTLPGIYRPTVSGPYANLGGLVIDTNGKLNEVLFDGTTFVNVETLLPEPDTSNLLEAKDQSIPVLERVDFSTVPVTPNASFSVQGKDLVYTKQTGDASTVLVRYNFPTPNLVTNNRYVSFRGTSKNGAEASVILRFLNSGGVAMTNQNLGYVPINGSRSVKVNNEYNSQTVSVQFDVSIYTVGLAVGDKITIKDIVVTDYQLPDFRGNVIELERKSRIDRIDASTTANTAGITKVNSALNGAVELISYDNTIASVKDRIITKFGGAVETEVGYNVSPLISLEGVHKIEVLGTMNNGATARSPILFYTGSTWYNKLVPICYRAPMPMSFMKEEWGTANNIRVGVRESLKDGFYLRLHKGNGKSYDILSTNGFPVESLEKAQKQFPSAKIVNVGSFNARKIVENPLPISLTNTTLSGYEALGKSNRIPDKVTVTETFANRPYIYHIGKFTGKVYCQGAEYGGIYCANNLEEYFAGNIVLISTANIYPGVVGIREMANGELVVMSGNAVTGGAVDPRAGIYVSNGWKTNSKTNTLTDFIIKQKWGSVRNAPVDSWGLKVEGRKVMVSEYSTAGATFENSYVYYSDDFGQTFRTIYDIETHFGNSNLRTPPTAYHHIHGCCIDPYWNRLWVMLGENSVSGMAISYSDDEGLTWVHLSTDYQEKRLTSDSYTWMKYCSSWALDTGIIMGTDSQPNGVWRFNRTTKNMVSGSVVTCIEEALRFKTTDSTISHIMSYMNRVQDDTSEYPIIICAPLTGEYANVPAISQTGIVYMSYDGVRFFEVWRETDPAFRAPQNFRDDNMQAWLFKDNTIYIQAKYFDGTTIRNRIIKGICK